MDSLVITQYEPQNKDAFYTINAEWLHDIYSMTPEDEKLLRSPEQIVASGGEVFFALIDSQPVGTCALLQAGHDEFELVKMGVLKAWRRKKVGEALLEATLDYARKRKAKKITLETASQLKPAIALYEKFGFTKTSDEYVHPLFGRVIFKMERML